MKTTIDLPDALLAKAKRQAKREGTTLRAILERGLRRALDPQDRPRAFKLRDASVGGRGLHPDAAGGWDVIRDRIYRDHGA